MSYQIVPLQSAPNQTFTVQLLVNAQPLTLNISLSFSEMAGYWQMVVSDVNGSQLLACVPLITGWWPAANLLEQYQYLNIGSAFLLNTGNASVDYPDAGSLGLFSLLWGDNV